MVIRKRRMKRSSELRNKKKKKKKMNRRHKFPAKGGRGQNRVEAGAEPFTTGGTSRKSQGQEKQGTKHLRATHPIPPGPKLVLSKGRSVTSSEKKALEKILIKREGGRGLRHPHPCPPTIVDD